MLIIILGILGMVVIAGGALGYFLSHPMFGRLPRGERLKRLQSSPNYSNGSFVNRVPKPHMAEGVTMRRLAWDFFFRSNERLRPSQPLPVEKTDLAALPLSEDIVIWLGHSSLYLHLGGKRFLVDPNFTRYASPFTWRTYPFEGTDLYNANEIPDVDYLLITHDHFDHLNYETVVAMKERTGMVVCGLGVGEYLEYWGVPADKILELDWEESVRLTDRITLYSESTHHFSGRTLWKRNPALWLSFILETPNAKLYIGGDGGYGPHFADIGRRHGPFDLVLLENGQYDANWKYNHMYPEEVMQAAEELRTKRLLPVHAGRFVLANHAWDEPYRLLSELHQNREFELITPKIGEPVFLKNIGQIFPRWWENISD